MRSSSNPPRAAPPRLAPYVCLLWTLLLNAQSSEHLPVGDATDTFLYGQLRLKDGGAPPDLAALEAICAGQVYVIGFSDVDGRFGLLLHEGGPRLFTGLGVDDISRDTLASCELRISLPNYRSGRVSLRATTLRPTIGPVLLTRIGNASDYGQPEASVTAPAFKAYRRGAQALGNSRWAKAEKAFESALRLSPEYSRAWNGLGMAREGAHELEQALSCYAKSVSLRPTYASAYVRFASVAARLERWQLAAQYSKAVLGLDPLATPEAYALFALANLRLKRLDIAESNAREGLRIDPDDGYPELHLLLAQALAGRKEYGESAQHLEQYLALVPDDANASLIRHELSAIRANDAERSARHR
jgi:tetratricopeptide (TPR) repeat protein